MSSTIGCQTLRAACLAMPNINCLVLYVPGHIRDNLARGSLQSLFVLALLYGSKWPPPHKNHFPFPIPYNYVGQTRPSRIFYGSEETNSGETYFLLPFSDNTEGNSDSGPNIPHALDNRFHPPLAQFLSHIIEPQDAIDEVLLALCTLFF